MLVIAVAGGTGDVGQTVVDELLIVSKFKIVVLTRENSGLQKRQIQDGTVPVAINYSDVDSLARRLEENAVHTIISTLPVTSEECSQSQVNLIRAADKATCTKRFIPSEYAHINTPGLLELDPTTRWWLDAVDSLKQSNLKYTRFATGFFMDYWGMPHVNTHLAPFSFGIDMRNCQAAIPGDGNDRLSLTYSKDLAKFVVRTLDLDEWPEFSIGAGDDVTFNEMLRLAEEARGKKFQVTYDSVDCLNEGRATMLPIPEGAPFSADEMTEYNTVFGQFTVRGIFHMPTENRLRFPDLKPLTFKEFLNKAWEGR